MVKDIIYLQEEENKMQEKKKREFPDVYALLFIMCVLAMVATWIIPAGTFERVKEGSINKVVAGSFQYVAANPQTPWDMLQAIYQAFVNSSSTIFMIFFCGAAIAMLEESKSLSTAFTVLARKLRGKEAVAMAVIMFSLGLGNSAGVFGNLGIAIVPIGVFLAKAMGGDAFLGFLIIYFGLMSGMSIGFANPGILGLAQTIAELPIFSGTLPRVICCVANITFLFFVTVRYYKTIKKDPTKSLNYEPGMQPYEYMGTVSGETGADSECAALSKRQILVMTVFGVGVIACVTFTIRNSWTTKQISSWFLGLGIVTGIVSGFDMNKIARTFIKGCKPMVFASFMVGFATAVSLVMTDGQVMDTIVNALSMPLNAMGSVLGAGFMVVINALINLLIPSGSGQAAVVMPLMMPLADLSGITRQVAVQAFQFGDGLSNLATPLNGPLMGCLALAGVNFPKYFKWAIKYIFIEIGVAVLVTMGLQLAGWTGL